MLIHPVKTSEVFMSESLIQSFKPGLSKLGPGEFSYNLPEHTCMEVSSIPSKSLIS